MLALSFYGADSDLPPILTSLENLQPVFNDSALTPYQNVNDGLDPWCEHAGRKAFYGTGLTKVHPEAVVAVWNSYLKFWRSNKDFGKTAFTLDVLGKKAIEDVDEDKTAFPHRGVNGYAYVYCAPSYGTSLETNQFLSRLVMPYHGITTPRMIERQGNGERKCEKFCVRCPGQPRWAIM